MQKVKEPTYYKRPKTKQERAKDLQNVQVKASVSIRKLDKISDLADKLRLNEKERIIVCLRMLGILTGSPAVVGEAVALAHVYYARTALLNLRDFVKQDDDA